MDEQVLKDVTIAMRLVRHREHKALGELPRLRDLRVVQGRLQQPVELVPPAFVGAVIETLFKEVIAALKPISDKDPDDPDWRNYIVLHDYFVLGEPWKIVADRLGVGRARFFEIMSSAIDALALAFMENYALADTAAPPTPQVKHNLPRPMYQFVRRSDEAGQDLVKKVIRGLTRRPWVVSIRGQPGVGKTTLALEVARRCVERAYFDAVIWIAARTEQEEHVTSLETVFNTIGQVLGDRRVVASESLEEKHALVIQNLATLPKCLIIIDNTEVFSEEWHRQIYRFIQQVPMTTAVLLTSRERGRASELETVITIEADQMDHPAGDPGAEAQAIEEAPARREVLPDLSALGDAWTIEDESKWAETLSVLAGQLKESGVIAQELGALTAGEDLATIREGMLGSIGALAVAQIEGHHVDTPLVVNQEYKLFAAILRNIPTELVGVPVEQSGTDWAEVNVVVRAESMEVVPHWTKNMKLVRGHNFGLLEFRLLPRDIGHKQIHVEFYYQRHWLAQLKFGVEVAQERQPASR